MNLAELQRRFGDALRAMGNPAEAEECFDFAEAVVAPCARLSAQAQLEIYAEQYRVRHLASLRKHYPAVAHYLGQAAFDGLARDYLFEHPPRHFSLTKLGTALPEFVSQTEPFARNQQLCDLAGIEGALLFALAVTDSQPFTVAALSLVPAPEWSWLRVAFVHSLRLYQLGTRAHLYCAEVRQGHSVQLVMDRERLEQYLAEYSVCLVAVRKGITLECIEIDAVQYSLLEKLQRGLSISSACISLGSDSGLSLETLVEQSRVWITQWVSSGWVASVQLA